MQEGEEDEDEVEEEDEEDEEEKGSEVAADDLVNLLLGSNVNS